MVLFVVVFLKINIYGESSIRCDDKIKTGILEQYTADHSHRACEVSIREIIESKKEYSEHIYKNRYDLPFEEFEYVDDEGYRELEQLYAQVDFTSYFIKTNPDMYSHYIEKYRQLVNNEISFYETDTDEKYYLNQYRMLDEEYSQYTLDELTFFFFDMDEDGRPELGVTKYEMGSHMKRFIYFFKYKEETDKMIVWYRTESTYDWLIGSKKLGWQNYRYYDFIQLDENGDSEIWLEFIRDDFFTNGEMLYLVTSPRDKSGRLMISEEMKRQGFPTEMGWYYFQVTEEQFDELTERFFQVEEESKENINEVSYTYEELFGDD